VGRCPTWWSPCRI